MKKIRKNNEKMHTIAFLFVFALLPIVTNSSEKDFEIFENVSSFEVPIQQHFVNGNVLKAQKVKSLTKLEQVRGNRVKNSGQSKFGQKLLEVNFPFDYITANVSFGTPKQNFTVALSSGATRVWVLSRDYPRRLSKTQNVFNPEKSSTYKDLGKDFFQEDGSFSVHANFGSDTFGFGQAKIKNQAFGLADGIFEENNIKFPFDGVFGFNHLHPDAYKNGQEPTSPIDNLLKPLVQKIVTVYLEKAKSPSHGPSNGLITFGDIDREHCVEETSGVIPLNASLTRDNRFTFNLSRFHFGDIELRYPGNGYLDSSISTVRLPLDIFEQVIIKINAGYDYGLDLYTVPCNSTHSMYPLVFQVGPDNNPSYITIDPGNYVVDLDLGEGQCVLALELNNDEGQYKEETFVLGTPAFRSYSCYTYDFTENVIKLYFHKN